jgi:carbamoyltransferase
MIILGVSAYHADSAAAIIVDGRLIAVVEEERFRRVKHWAGFPSEAIRYCLAEAGLTIDQISHVAISRDPKAHLWRKAWFALSHRPKAGYLLDRLRNRSRVKDLGETLREALGVRRERVKAAIHYVEHHTSHMASAFYVSPFDAAAVASIDAMGDFVSTQWGVGKGRKLEVQGKIHFPHSLGFLYTAGTQYLGFPKYGDEYKVMGLAAYGEPDYLDDFRRIIRCKKDGTFALNLDYFRHHRDGVAMSWDGGEPVVGPLWSTEWERLLGPARKTNEEITPRHQAIAASLQAVFEEVYLDLLVHLAEETGLRCLCLAGGCAMNSVANGKILDQTPFHEIYIQSAAGDAGTAIGAAYSVWHERLGQPRSFVMDHSSWGPKYDRETCRKTLRDAGFVVDAVSPHALPLTPHESERSYGITEIANEDELCRKTAHAIVDGKVVGWFQGRMEWGPRALGNRSILADPRRMEMKEILNARIKRREPFRPFAPSILIEAVSDYFEKSYPDPFMLKVYQIKKEKRGVIPAVTHVDGSGRLQTVDRVANPRYWRLIKAFEAITGVPVVLNTSFNENEPIVCTPAEAVDCFARTKMDVLVLGDFFIERREASGVRA